MSRLHLRPRSSAATAPLDDKDLLPEILLRLPLQPSSLPRASAVCKFWRSLASDPGFCRRFRAHHRRNPPLLGCFVTGFRHVHFQPTLDPPNSISQARFSFPVFLAANRFEILGCRHGLVLFLDNPVGVGRQTQLLVWDPFTGDQHRLDIPPDFGMEETYFSDGRMDESSIGAAVLRAPGDIHHFQVVLVSNSYMQKSTQAVASVYSSATGVWDNPISTPLPPEDFPIRIYMDMPPVMVGGSFYWLIYGKFQGILEFDLDKQSLALIPLPMAVENADGIVDHNQWLVLAEGGGLGFLFLTDFCAQVWERKTDCKGASSWVLGKSIDLKKLLPFNPSDLDMDYPLAVGFAEENNVMLLSTCAGVFTVQFESLQFKKLFESRLSCYYYPFEAVYTADRGIGGGRYGAKLLLNT